MHDNRRVLPRVYAPELRTDADFALPADEVHHLTKVLRLGPGAGIEVFDGRGSVYRAVLSDVQRSRAVARVVQALPAAAAPGLDITVVQAVLKGSSMDDAVRDATMMGASAIQPVVSEHVVVKSSQVMREENRDRWARVALAAVKQSRRATLPVIAPVQLLDELFATAAAGTRLIFVEPSAAVVGQSLRSLAVPAAAMPVRVLLGPEGGWSPREVDAAVACGWVPVSLGPMTLRAESMAVAALAALWGVWGG